MLEPSATCLNLKCVVLSTASIYLNISGVMNITLLQNTLSCKKLDPHAGAGQTTSKPLACRIMNWISLPLTLIVAMFCCSPGETLDKSHYLLAANKTFHWCHVDLAWSCAQVLEGTACIVVTQIPPAHPPMLGQPCFASPACTRGQFGQHSLPKGKQGIDRSYEYFPCSSFKSFQLHLDVT